MDSKSTSVKEKILQAAMEFVTSETNTENITSRQVANKAGVNHAMINYYFQSKDNLFSQAVEIKMGHVISQVLEQCGVSEDAVMKLKRLLISTADYSFNHNKVFRIAAARDLKEGCKSSCALVMPMLKEIFNDKDDIELKIIALQLILPSLNIVLYPEVYSDYLNTDFFDNQQRTNKINQIIDIVLFKKGGST